MRYLAAVGLLGTACLVWSAVPLHGTGVPGLLLLVVAAALVGAGLLRLAFKDLTLEARHPFPGVLVDLGHWAHANLLLIGWETGAAIAMVGLEAVHKSHPWHTGLLALGLAAYLLAVHRAESAVPAAALRGQARALIAGVVLLALCTGVATIPAAGAGTLSAWLEVVAALAAITAGGLALPL